MKPWAGKPWGGTKAFRNKWGEKPRRSKESVAVTIWTE